MISYNDGSRIYEYESQMLEMSEILSNVWEPNTHYTHTHT